MKKIILNLVIALIISSCNSKEPCNKQFKENLAFLKEYRTNKDKTYKLEEIEDKIEFLEIQSGIEAKDKGNIIGRFIVSEDDITNWENWLKKECDLVNKSN